MKKIGIVLGGGGAKGAFQVGVLECILKEIQSKNYELAAISGTSIGAMNGAFLASGQFETLKNFWLNWKNKNCPFTQSGALGTWSSLVLNGYAFKSEPIFEFFSKNLDTKKLCESKISYTNTRVRLEDGDVLLGGTYPLSNAIRKRKSDIILEIMASMSAIPILPSVNVYGENCVDGGFRDTIPVKALLDSNPIKFDHIFVINCNLYNRVSYKKSISNTNRSLFEKLKFVYDDILWDEISRNDIEMGKLKYWNSDTYTVICPEQQLIGAAEFDPIKIRQAIQHGRDVWSKISTLN